MKLFRPLLSAAVALLVLNGCASLETPQGQTGLRVGIEAATVGYIERTSNHADAAHRVLEAVALVRSQLSTTQTSVADLRGALLQQLAARDLTPGEKLLALEVINGLSDQVQLKVGTGLLDAQAITTVGQVLDYVTNTAQLYVPQSR